VGDDNNVIRGRFPGDDVSESAAFQRWHADIDDYLQEQGLVAAIRNSEQPRPPWPAKGNPMLGYIIDRAREIVADTGVDAALLWLGVHAWFEGAVADRAHTVGVLIDDT
jgi:hypothetical protein